MPTTPMRWKNEPDLSTPLNADLLNGWSDDLQLVAAEAAVSAAEAAASAEFAGAPTDGAMATAINNAVSAARVALNALFAMKSVVDSRAYGTLGDGATDDTTALQSALTAVAPGGTVYLAAGTYPVAAKLVIPSGVTIQGVPGRTILLAKAASAASPLLLEIASVSDVTVRGVTFDGNQANVANFNNVVTVFSSTRVRFEGCAWRSTRGIGLIFSTDVSHCGVSGSVFTEVGTLNKVTTLLADRRAAIAFSSGTKANNKGNWVTGCVFVEVGLDCVSMTTQSEGLIAHNRIYSNYAGGLYVSGCSLVKVVGNHVEGLDGSGNGIDVSASDQVTVVGNTVRARGAGGILVADVTNSTITGNVAMNNWRSGTSAHLGGIVVAGATACTNITITGNVCGDDQGTKTQQWGVQITNLPHVGIWVDPSNLLGGNVLGAVGGGGVFSPYAITPTWVSWTPGDATVAARYTSARDRVTFQGLATIGTTVGLTGSSVYLGLPVTPHASLSTNAVLGTFVAIDNTPGANTARKAGTILRSGSNGLLVFLDGTLFTSASPWTWATGDQFTWNLSYMPA